MLDTSALALDRRRETGVIALVFILLLMNAITIEPFSSFIFNSLQLVLAGVSMLLSAIWMLIRLVRLRSVRPSFFLFGVLANACLHLLLVGMMIASCFIEGWIPEWRREWGLVLSCLLLVTFSISMLYFILKPSRKWINKIGLPVFKPLHFVIAMAAIACYFAGLLPAAVLFSAVSLFLGVRYGFNRWIFVSTTTYPFRMKAPQAFIKSKLYRRKPNKKPRKN